MIWLYSFKPQLISLHYAKCPSTQHTSPSIGRDDSHYASPLPSPTQLEPVDVAAPAAFSVCRASRAIALSKAYKTWRMTRSDGKVRDLLWDPLVDIILFVGAQDSYFTPLLLFDLLVQQFSDQASEIRRLVLPHYFWDVAFVSKSCDIESGHLDDRSWGLLRLLQSPSSLQEMFFMVDEEFFESEVKGKAEDELEFRKAPDFCGDGFHSHIERHRYKHGEDSLASPKVSVAWNFEMILRGEDFELPEGLLSGSLHARLEVEKWRLPGNQ